MDSAECRRLSCSQYHSQSWWLAVCHDHHQRKTRSGCKHLDLGSAVGNEDRHRDFGRRSVVVDVPGLHHRFSDEEDSSD